MIDVEELRRLVDGKDVIVEQPEPYEVLVLIDRIAELEAGLTTAIDVLLGISVMLSGYDTDMDSAVGWIGSVHEEATDNARELLRLMPELQAALKEQK